MPTFFRAYEDPNAETFKWLEEGFQSWTYKDRRPKEVDFNSFKFEDNREYSILFDSLKKRVMIKEHRTDMRGAIEETTNYVYNLSDEFYNLLRELQKASSKNIRLQLMDSNEKPLFICRKTLADDFGFKCSSIEKEILELYVKEMQDRERERIRKILNL